MTLKLSALWALIAIASPALGETLFAFQTPYDNFELVLAGGKGTVDGKPANLTAFSEIQSILTNPMASLCNGAKGKPAMTVKRIDGDVTETRQVYPQMGYVTDGKNCLNVSGDGLHYLPVHRDFFIGAPNDEVTLKSPLIFSRGGKVFMTLKKKGKDWVSEAAEPLINWDFLERFENSLKDFKIRLRVQTSVGNDKPKFSLKSGGQTYEFYKMTNVLWAMKKPGAKWLEASDDWSFWYDMDEHIFADRYSEQIKVAGDLSRAKPERQAALDRLEVTWSRNLRDLYHHLLLTQNEEADLQAVALKRLKAKPSVETAGVIIKFLEGEHADELKREAGVILKLQNPKGPKYNPSAGDEEKARILEFWRTWWKKNQGKEA